MSSEELVGQVRQALRKAMDNISMRRDPIMRCCSFDVHALDAPPRYLVAVPEDLHPAVQGMLERKLTELPAFDHMERNVASLGRGYIPVGFYEAGAVWAPITMPFFGPRFDRRRLSAVQLRFEFDE